MKSTKFLENIIVVFVAFGFLFGVSNVLAQTNKYDAQIEVVKKQRDNLVKEAEKKRFEWDYFSRLWTVCNKKASMMVYGSSQHDRKIEECSEIYRQSRGPFDEYQRIDARRRAKEEEISIIYDAAIAESKGKPSIEEYVRSQSANSATTSRDPNNPSTYLAPKRVQSVTIPDKPVASNNPTGSSGNGSPSQGVINVPHPLGCINDWKQEWRSEYWRITFSNGCKDKIFVTTKAGDYPAGSTFCGYNQHCTLSRYAPGGEGLKRCAVYTEAKLNEKHGQCAL